MPRAPTTRKRWTVAAARRDLARLLAMAAREPQAVYRRDRLIANVVNPELAARVEEAWKAEASKSLGDDLADLRRLCADEEYTLAAPTRADRGGVRRKRARER